MGGPLLIGIDIGGTKIAGGIVDSADGRVLFSDRTPTRATEGGPAVLERAISLAVSLRDTARQQGQQITAAGVGAGGQIDPDAGDVVAASEILPRWAGIPLRNAFAEALQIPASVDNDVNALAAGECHYGAGRGCRNLLYLALGTGVGGALVVNGRLYHSIRGAGGELGHLTLFPDGLPCTCGGRGCLEQYTNGDALARYWREGDEAVLRAEADLLPDASLDTVTGPQIAEMAHRFPDGLSHRAVRRTGEMLGLGLVSLANIFAPEKIVIGGGMAAMGDLLLDPARDLLARRALPGARDCPVVPAALGENASLIGAAALALK